MTGRVESARLIISALEDVLPGKQEGAGEIKVTAQKGERWLLTIGRESYVVLGPSALEGLSTLPDAADSTRSIFSFFRETGGAVLLAGAMRSGKSAVFNQTVIRTVNFNLETGNSAPLPVVVGRAKKGRQVDVMAELQKNIGSFASFNFQIEGPLDFLYFVEQQLEGRRGKLRLAALEEVGILLFSREEYLAKVLENIDFYLGRAGLPDQLKESFEKALQKSDPAQCFGEEFVLMTQALGAKGINFIGATVDRFTSGQPWPPTAQFCAMARESEKYQVHRRFSECLGCGEPAVISAVTEPLDKVVKVGKKDYRIYRVITDLSGSVEAVEPYFAPLCAGCNDQIRSGLASADWPEIWVQK